MTSRRAYPSVQDANILLASVRAAPYAISAGGSLSPGETLRSARLAAGVKQCRHWLIEKFLRDPETLRSQAIQQIAQVMPVLMQLIEQAGIATAAKGKR